MEFNLVADSSCDFSQELQDKMNISVEIAPLTITMDENVYVDDANVNMKEFLQNLLTFEKITSGAPAPASYLNGFKSGCMNFVVTLSSKISGSYASAVTASDICEKENCDVHVFDSKSASGAQLLTLLKLKELIDAKHDKNQIIESINKFIDSIKTYYVSQDLSVFIKSGRLSKIKGRLLTVLGIKPVLGADGNGEIALFTQARGENQIISKFIHLIKESGKKPEDGTVVITHCDNQQLADRLKEKIEQTFNFKNIIITPTRALSSMYVNTKGIIIAF